MNDHGTSRRVIKNRSVGAVAPRKRRVEIHDPARHLVGVVGPIESRAHRAPLLVSSPNGDVPAWFITPDGLFAAVGGFDDDSDTEQPRADRRPPASEWHPIGSARGRAFLACERCLRQVEVDAAVAWEAALEGARKVRRVTAPWRDSTT